MCRAHLVVVMVELGGVDAVVVRTELEQMREGGEQEQKHLEQQLLGRPNAQDGWQQEHQLHLDHLDHHHQRHEAHHQLLLEELVCKREHGRGWFICVKINTFILISITPSSSLSIVQRSASILFSAKKV